MKYKIGDRFRWDETPYDNYATLIEYVGEEGFITLESHNTHKGVGRLWKGWNIEANWKFVGNFSKSKNFSNLYELLSDEL